MTHLDRQWWTERLAAMTEPERDAAVLRWTLRLLTDMRSADYHVTAVRTYSAAVFEVAEIRKQLPIKEKA